ncbi:hypothetical protein [Petrocella sp. FN5]|uniref:hypothetical protein n=1 Tax=Petrocella sp. FN5 TaxID=3032002 RepID=UPI0023DB2B81|nr:hypothetical protein [Petrocella sp. FN5]MDF1618778.1 hypothetical protein [Petrocella sp. FN5]
MWNNIVINGNQIEVITEKSVLIKMPKASGYEGYKFWHTIKLVRRKGGMYTFSFNEEFVFELKKNGKGKWNSRSIISEMSIDAEEMIKAFDNQNY